MSTRKVAVDLDGFRTVSLYDAKFGYSVEVHLPVSQEAQEFVEDMDIRISEGLVSMGVSEVEALSYASITRDALENKLLGLALVDAMNKAR